MSKLSEGKLYNMGVYLRSNRLESMQNMSWFEISNTDEFEEAITRHKITPAELKIVKSGFDGKPLPSSVTETKGDVVVPFGVHKGKSMSKIPMDQIVYWSEQAWITKWPTVLNWIRQNQDKVDKYKEEYQEGLNSISELTKNLKEYD